MIPLITLVAFQNILLPGFSLLMYDQLRQLSLMALLLFGGSLVLTVLFFPRSMDALLPASVTGQRWLMLGLMTVFAGMGMSLWPHASLYALADAGLYGLLSLGILCICQAMTALPQLTRWLSALIALLPLLTVWHLFPYLWHSLQQPTAGYLDVGDWHGQFSNIRMYDDALLVCLVLLWWRPALLSHRFADWPVLLISTTYLFSLMMDGSRATLLGLSVGLFSMGLLNPTFRSGVFLAGTGRWLSPARLMIASFLLAGLAQWVLRKGMSLSFHHLERGENNLTSGRVELWQKALSLWQQHPFLGFGGDQLGRNPPFLSSMHPHQLFLQWLSEWGITGLICLIFLLKLYQIFWQLRARISAPLAIGLIATLVNLQLSGMGVYPLSQLLVIWLLGLCWAQTRQPYATRAQQDTVALKTSSSAAPVTPDLIHLEKQTLVERMLGGRMLDGRMLSEQLLSGVIAALAVMFMAMLLYSHGTDLVAKGQSLDSVNAPRFWQYGRALHLTGYEFP